MWTRMKGLTTRIKEWPGNRARQAPEKKKMESKEKETTKEQIDITESLQNLKKLEKKTETLLIQMV